MKTFQKNVTSERFFYEKISHIYCCHCVAIGCQITVLQSPFLPLYTPRNGTISTLKAHKIPHESKSAISAIIRKVEFHPMFIGLISFCCHRTFPLVEVL